MNKAVLAGILIVWVCGCKSTTQVSAPVAKDPVEGIVFLTFVMREDSSSEKRIELIAKTIVKQKMKGDPQASTAPSRILIRQLNASNNTLSMVPMDHPLYRRVEYANEKGEFESKTVKLADAEFFARVTLFVETKFIQVEEEVAGNIVFTKKFNIRD